MLHRCQKQTRNSFSSNVRMTKRKFPEQHLSTDYMHTNTHNTHNKRERQTHREREREMAHLASLLCKSIVSQYDKCTVKGEKTRLFHLHQHSSSEQWSYHHSQPRVKTWLMAATCQLRKSSEHAWLHLNWKVVNYMATQRTEGSVFHFWLYRSSEAPSQMINPPLILHYFYQICFNLSVRKWLIYNK